MLLAYLGLLVTACGSVAALITSIAVYRQLKTQNGISVAGLAERAEGHRIAAEVPAELRTTSEQGYVDLVGPGSRDVGHTGPDDRTAGSMPRPGPEN